MTREEAEREAAKRERHKSKHMHNKRWSAEHDSIRGWHVALVDNFVSKVPVLSQVNAPSLYAIGIAAQVFGVDATAAALRRIAAERAFLSPAAVRSAPSVNSLSGPAPTVSDRTGIAGGKAER